MSYDEAFCDAPYDTSESDAEQAAHHQKALDGAYLLAHGYDMTGPHARLLCELASISFDEFCRYTGETK